MAEQPLRTTLRLPDIQLSPSADGILDVTPVTSSESADPEARTSAAARNGGSDNMRSQNQVNAYFSSSSEEDEDFDDDDDGVVENEDGSQYNSEDEEQSDSSEEYNHQSEWDKAMMAGKPSTGRAADFFTARSMSTDSDALFSRSEQEILKQVDAALSDGPLDPAAAAPAREREIARQQLSQQQQQQSQHSTTALPGTPLSPRSGSGVPPPPPPSVASGSSTTTSISILMPPSLGSATPVMRPHPADDDHLSAGVLPDVFLNMRQKIESLTLFDSDMMKLAADQTDDDPMTQESRESLKRSSQQSISAAVLVSLAHKRYERRRLAAMEIEKVVRSLVSQSELDRVRAILLLLSDDYVRSTSEDARKGGVVALAASAIGLKKGYESDATVQECRDLILASVVHACQDHSQRVRYYATESLFNVVKVIPALAVQHFFILFEILRSLYADVDADVRSGADLLDKKLKEVIISAMNQGTFTADACVPVFARFVHMRNKATKLLTLTWLQELNEKLVGAPILEFLHLFLSGIYDMVADPTVAIRQSALAFLQSVLPKLLAVNSDEWEESGMKVDFDKILQSLVTTMEHPDPFVRKVAMYWMSRIVKAHMVPDEFEVIGEETTGGGKSAASASVRNSVPHVLPGILLSISDSYNSTAKDSFLPDQSTRALAEQTNTYLQDAVRRDGSAYIHHLDAFIFALREELDSPGGIVGRNPPALERTPYRLDVKPDGTGIETSGWFRASSDTRDRNDEAMVMSRLCALEWVTVLYEKVVPVVLKAYYAREFILAIIHQLVDNPPKTIVRKSLEVIAKITVPVDGETITHNRNSIALPGLASPVWASSNNNDVEEAGEFPMTQENVESVLTILDAKRRRLKSRDRQVFSALVELHSFNEHLLVNLSDVLTLMCQLQPPEFVFVSFAVELDKLIRRQLKRSSQEQDESKREGQNSDHSISKDLSFVSSFVQHMSHVLLHAKEARALRDALKDCMRPDTPSDKDKQRTGLFHILLHTFAHNIAATISLCLWAGAYRTAFMILAKINPLDISLMFLLEIDRVVEMLERPFFRHLHVRMLEHDRDPTSEGSGTMLFQLLKSLLMILPQSTCYNILKDRLTSVSRFRQSATCAHANKSDWPFRWTGETQQFVDRIETVRFLHCTATWYNIRAESLETPKIQRESILLDEGADRRGWLGYASKEEEEEAKRKYREGKNNSSSSPLFSSTVTIEELKDDYQDLDALLGETVEKLKEFTPNEEIAPEEDMDAEQWKNYWANSDLQ